MAKLLLRGSILRKIFLTYFALFVMVLFAIGMLNYLWTSHIVYKQTKDMHMVLLEKTNELINAKFDELNTFSTSLANVSWIRKVALMNGGRIDFRRMGQLELADHLAELKVYGSINDFLDNFAIYLNGKDIFLHPGSYDSSKWFFANSYKFANVNPNDWIFQMDSMHPSSSAQTFSPKDVKNYLVDKRVIVYLKVLPIVDGAPRATLFAMISEDKIKKMVSEALPSFTNSTYVLDNNNNIVTSVNPNPNFDKVVAEGAISHSSGVLPQYVKDSHGRKHFVFHVSSNAGPAWKYVMFIPVDTVMASANMIKNVTILLSIVLFLLGILFCYRFTLVNYMPVKKLTQLIKDSLNNTPLEANRNEYNFIEMGIRDMYLTDQKNQKKMEKFNSIAIMNEFMGLIKGDGMTEGDDSDYPHIRQIYGKPLFATVIFDEGQFPKDLPETFEEVSWFAYRIKHGSQAVCIINMDEPEKLEDAINNIKSYFSDKVTIGIGNTCQLLNLRHSYDEAYIAIDSKLIKGESGMISFADLSLRNEHIYYFPVNFEQELVKQVEGGHISALRKTLNDSVKGMLTQSNLSVSIDRHLFYKQVAVCINELPDDRLVELIGAFKDQLGTTKTIDDIQACMEYLYKQICADVKKDQEKKYDAKDLTGEILKFIDEHYAEPTMSLTVLADAFHMSGPQMSSFFKERTRESYLDYISKLRIGVAKNILAERKLKIEDVSRQVGYESVITFRRVFKKYVELTPTEFKDIG